MGPILKSPLQWPFKSAALNSFSMLWTVISNHTQNPATAPYPLIPSTPASCPLFLCWAIKLSLLVAFCHLLSLPASYQQAFSKSEQDYQGQGPPVLPLYSYPPGPLATVPLTFNCLLSPNASQWASLFRHTFSFFHLFWMLLKAVGCA